MGRYHFTAYLNDTRPRYVVLWGLQWQILECLRLEPAADLSGAMAAAIVRLQGNGWRAEGDADYGFVFMRRQNERRLLMLTTRDPYDTTPQHFSFPRP